MKKNKLGVFVTAGFVAVARCDSNANFETKSRCHRAARLLGLMVAMSFLLLFTVCKATGSGGDGDTSAGKQVPATWTMDASARASEGTADLKLGFAPAVAGLSAGDFTFEGADITADTLTGGGASPKLSVSGVPAAGTVRVSVKKEGFDFNPDYYDWDIANGSTEAGEEEPGAQPEANVLLASLEVKKNSAGSNLVQNFTPATGDYTIELSAALNTGGTLNIEAGAEDTGAAVSFVPESKSIALPLTEATSFRVDVANGGEASYYIVNIVPPQSASATDKTLLSLSVRYDEDSQNLLTGANAFNPASTQYSVMPESGAASVMVEAIAASSEATVEIIYGGVSKGSGEGRKTATGLALPATGSQELKIKVTSDSNNFDYQYYTVTVNAVALARKTYNGTVTYSGSGKTIVGLIARDGSYVAQSPLLASAGEANSAWTLEVADDYEPESFVVELKDASNKSYISKPIYPASITTGSPIAVSVADAGLGKAIFNATDLKSIGNSNSAAWTLASDIDVGEIANWAGPSGFSGTFYGNHHNIKNLMLVATTGSTGLFATTSSGAKIYDFTLSVSSTPNLTPSGGGSFWFGGVIGSPVGSTTVKGVTVTGDLSLGGSINAGYILLGGFIGEIKGTGAVVLIEDCASEVNIVVKSLDNLYTVNITNMVAIGGFIGSVSTSSSVTIKNSYSSGNLEVDFKDDVAVTAGGFMGITQQSTSFENCYASGRVSVNNVYSPALTATAFGEMTLAAGGFLGGVRSTVPAFSIVNCAAVGSEVNAVGTVQTAAYFGTNKLIGLNKKTGITNTNNFVLDTMTCAATNGETGTAKSLSDLKTKTTWTNAAASGGLGFSETVWDFTGITGGVWPKLRNRDHTL